MSDPSLRIFVSGLYSGPSPSAGLGVARALRAHFPRVELIGVDYWAGSSGLHHDVFDKTWLKPSWDLIEPGLYVQEIQDELDRGALWLPTLDLEVDWLGRNFEGARRGLLCPTRAALSPTVKPLKIVAERLGLKVAAVLEGSATEERLHAFCREHSWRVWLKGPQHEALAVRSWPELLRARAHLRERWQSERWFLQAHVRGYEESICFSAVDGELVDAIYMRKRITTPDGKTWAGRIVELPGQLAEKLRALVAELAWTGGAEIELLRDVDGGLWYLELNPRFPGWVYGTAIAGRNLPAALVARAIGRPVAPTPMGPRREFTRVVLEIPARGDLPLPLPTQPEHDALGAQGKYGASLSILSAKAETLQSPSSPQRLDPVLRQALEVVRDGLPLPHTPARIFLPGVAQARFDAVKRRFAAAPAAPSGRSVRFTTGYSVKTSPDARLLTLARSAGMLAECISQLEVKRALDAGWREGEIILNGPGKWWPEQLAAPKALRAVFCDSIEELEQLVRSSRQDRLWGLRLRVPGLSSRFGVRVDDPDAFDRACSAIRLIPEHRELGLHVHMASNLVGNGHWRDAVETTIVWAKLIEQSTGHPVQLLDWGGGYHPDDIDRLPFADMAEHAAMALPALREIVVEPGRAVCQDSMALITRVLDVRRRDRRIDEVVVDASIAELPLASVYPHRFVVMRDGESRALPRGSARVLGRICMEDDVLAQGLQIPEDLAVGDVLAVCDAGAYEGSMSYEFGRGGYPTP